MGNSYIAKTARLEVKGGNQTITIVSTKSVDDLQFWYYADGSVSGEELDAETVTDVVVGGKTYPLGFSFPLFSDSEYAGVKFQASIMPLSPSARVKIDYSGAVRVADLETTTQPTTAPTTAEAIVTTTQPATVEESSTEPSTQEETTEEAETTEAPTGTEDTAVLKL